MLSDRHFTGDLDPTAEKQLRDVNASLALLDALKSGNNAASVLRGNTSRSRPPRKNSM